MSSVVLLDNSITNVWVVGFASCFQNYLHNLALYVFLVFFAHYSLCQPNFSLHVKWIARFLPFHHAIIVILSVAA